MPELVSLPRQALSRGHPGPGQAWKGLDLGFLRSD